MNDIQDIVSLKEKSIKDLTLEDRPKENNTTTCTI